MLELHPPSRGCRAARIALSMLTLLLASGCESDEAGNAQPAPPGEELALTELHDRLVSSICKHLAECPTTWEGIEWHQFITGDDAICRKVVNVPSTQPQDPWFALRQVRLDELIEMVQDGLASYNGVAARACLDAVDSVCKPPQIAFSCLLVDAFDGTAAVGEACWRDEMCRGDAWCDANESTCPGVCRAAAALGQPCERNNSHAACAQTGLAGRGWCGGSFIGSGDCLELRDGTPAGEGQPCGPAQPVGNVMEFIPCQRGLACDTNAWTCLAPRTAGEACGRGDGPCAIGHMCVEVAEYQQECVAWEWTTEVGGACSGSPKTAPTCDGFRGLTCDEATLQCVSIGGSEGGSCLADFAAMFVCDEGLRCAYGGESATCTALQADGADCSGHGVTCVSGYCDAASGKCSAPGCTPQPSCWD